MSYFYRSLEWIRWMFGIFPRTALGSRTKYLIVHYSFVAVVAILLAVFSDGIRRLIGFSPEGMEYGSGRGNAAWFLDKVLCAVLFLLFYAIVRIVLLLLQLLGIQEEPEFPDLEADWQDIQSALNREELFFDELPVFLVNGLTPDQEKSAFESACNITWRVRGAPFARPNAAVRAFASESAIYLSFTNVGTTNIQQGKVIDDPGTMESEMFQPASSVTGTIKAGALPRVPAPLGSATGTSTVVTAPSVHAPSGPATAAPQRGMAFLFGTMAPGGLNWATQTVNSVSRSAKKGYGKKRVEPLTSLDTQVGVRRMQFLCSLISRARHPYCQINGLIQAYPLSWASNAEYAKGLAPAIREDLLTIHNSFQLQFPVVAMVTESDSVAGIRDFLMRTERMQPGIRMTRAGSSFAPGAALTDQNAEWIVDKALAWFRAWIYTAFSTDLDNRDNQKLFQMMCEISQRRKDLTYLLSSTMYKVVSPGLRLYGVYFSAIGRNEKEQGFIRGVLDKVFESRDSLAWTPKLVSEQKRSSLFSMVFGIGALLMFIAAIAIYYVKIYSKNSQ